MEYLLYRLIQEIQDKMTGIPTIDEDYGQLEAIDNDNIDEYPLTFPAVLVDAPDCTWTEMQGGHQKGEATIRVKLCIDCYDDTHATSGTMDAILERQEMVNKLHKVVQEFAPGGDLREPLIRTSSTFRTANHGIKVYESQYTVTVSEEEETKTKIRVSPTIRVTMLRNHDLFASEFAEVFD